MNFRRTINYFKGKYLPCNTWDILLRKELFVVYPKFKLDWTACIFFFLIFWLCHMACGILVPPPGIEPAPPALETRSLNHWTAREVLNSLYLNGRPCGEGLPEGWASACLIPENLFKSAAIFEYILLRAESCSSPDAGLWSTAGMKRQAGLTLH